MFFSASLPNSIVLRNLNWTFLLFVLQPWSLWPVVAVPGRSSLRWRSQQRWSPSAARYRLPAALLCPQQRPRRYHDEPTYVAGPQEGGRSGPRQAAHERLHAVCQEVSTGADTAAPRQGQQGDQRPVGGGVEGPAHGRQGAVLTEGQGEKFTHREQGFGAGAGVFGWSRSRHFGPAAAPP